VNVVEAKRDRPHHVELKAGQTVLWCRCGRSARQPFCDGSHAGTGIEPVRYRAAQDEEVLLCGCKRTTTAPHCDGSHNALATAYGADDPHSEANRAIVAVGPDADGKARIDGGCFVCNVDARAWRQAGGARWTDLIAESDGARWQAQFCVDVDPGLGPVVAFGDRHVALLVLDSHGELEICGRRFAIDTRVPGDASRRAEVGAYVKPGEAFRLRNDGARPMRVFASVAPTVEAPEFPAAMTGRFDGAHPDRLAPVDPAQRQAMADRFFQVMVSKAHGSTMLTQFIGEIPRSKAWPHRHLYEESLIVVAGEGMMWTETRRTPVRTGDVIFLPRKQKHSLECTSDTPMFVAGVIYPGDNPSINYYD
jgi:CDGSH-type Zn-finger protein/mannose-6-phosphate isomerase-like protein (cupin superfamily)